MPDQGPVHDVEIPKSVREVVLQAAGETWLQCDKCTAWYKVPGAQVPYQFSAYARLSNKPGPLQHRYMLSSQVLLGPWECKDCQAGRPASGPCDWCRECGRSVCDPADHNKDSWEDDTTLDTATTRTFDTRFCLLGSRTKASRPMEAYTSHQVLFPCCNKKMFIEKPSKVVEHFQGRTGQNCQLPVPWRALVVSPDANRMEWQPSDALKQTFSQSSVSKQKHMAITLHRHLCQALASPDATATAEVAANLSATVYRDLIDYSKRLLKGENLSSGEPSRRNSSLPINPQQPRPVKPSVSRAAPKPPPSRTAVQPPALAVPSASSFGRKRKLQPWLTCADDVKCRDAVPLLHEPQQKSSSLAHQPIKDHTLNVAHVTSPEAVSPDITLLLQGVPRVAAAYTAYTEHAAPPQSTVAFKQSPELMESQTALIAELDTLLHVLQSLKDAAVQGEDPGNDPALREVVPLLFKRQDMTEAEQMLTQAHTVSKAELEKWVHNSQKALQLKLIKPEHAQYIQQTEQDLCSHKIESAEKVYNAKVAAILSALLSQVQGVKERVAGGLGVLILAEVV